MPKLKTSKMTKPLKMSKSIKSTKDIEENNEKVYHTNKAKSPKKVDLKPKQSRQSKYKLKRKNEKEDSETELEKIPVITMEQKKELSESINSLPPEKLGEVVQIIQEAMPLV